MNIADIFQRSHKQLRLKDLNVLNEERYKEFNVDTCSYEQWVEDVTAMGYDVSRFRVDPLMRTLNIFFYVGEYITMGHPTLQREWIGYEENIKGIEADGHYAKLFNEGNYMVYFFPEMNSFAVDYFIEKVGEIPEDKRFKAFRDMYIILESGFTEFPDWLVDDILERSPRKESQEKVEKVTKVKKGKVRVYRGVHSVSTRLEDSISWTVSLGVAKKFANRYEKGEVYRAEVDLEDIIYYTDERNEKEVWVKYDTLESVKKIRG